jgi:hypothetical protein
VVGDAHALCVRLLSSGIPVLLFGTAAHSRISSRKMPLPHCALRIFGGFDSKLAAMLRLESLKNRGDSLPIAWYAFVFAEILSVVYLRRSYEEAWIKINTGDFRNA